MPWKSYEIKDLAKIRKLYSLFEDDFKYKYSFNGEAHNFWECVYVESGMLRVTADERVHDLKAGDIIFHKPLEFHRFAVTSKEGAKLLIFSFDLEGDIIGILRNRVFSTSSEQRAVISELKSYIVTQLNKHGFMTDKSLREGRYLEPFASIPAYSQMVKNYIYKLFLLLAEDGRFSAISTSREADIFRRVVDFMNDNICKQISVVEFAEQFGMSESSIKRIFEKYAGIGIHKYFLTLKIKIATSLLEEGKTVNEVSDLLGFSNQAYFSAAYKRETGNSPSKIKKI